MLLYLALLTVLLSFVLGFFNKKNNPNQLFLSGFFILTSIFGIAHHFVFQKQDVFWIAVFFNHFVPFMFLIGPLLFFYVRGTLEKNKKLSRWDSIHFIPALWSFIGTIPYYLLSFEKKEEIAGQLILSINNISNIDVNLFYDAGESFVLRTLLCIVYVVYSGYLVTRKYQSLLHSETKKNTQEVQVIRWLTVLLFSTLVISIIFIVLAVQVTYYEINDIIVNDYEYYVLTGVLYLMMALSLLQFPNVLYGLSLENSSDSTHVAAAILPATETKKQAARTVKKKTSKPIGTPLERIKLYLHTEKPYLDTQFSIFSIAVALGLPETQIINCIKNEMGTTFVKLRTELRVNHALGLLQNKTLKKLTIEAIGEQSGFKTRSNFYTAFKEITGKTPKEYLSEINNR